MKREGETKQKLLEVAMRLIWEQSYGSVGVEDICKQAGVTKGSFYFAFPSKADLAVAAFEEYWERKKPLLDSIFSSQIPPLEQFEKYCDLIVNDQRAKYETFGKMCGCPYCSLGSEQSTQDEKLRQLAAQMNERGLKYLVGAIRGAQAEGLIPQEDPRILAQQVFDFAVGILTHAKIENSPAALDRLKPGIFRILGLKLATV